MNEYIIFYKDLSPTEVPDRRGRINVALSKYQAYLFKSKIQMQKQLKRKGFFYDLYDKFKFSIIMGTMSLSCPRVAFLSYFHDTDLRALDKIEFHKYGDLVLVIFKPINN